MENENREILGYCVYCKDVNNPICEGDPYYVDEYGNLLHKECQRLLEDNSELFGE